MRQMPETVRMHQVIRKPIINNNVPSTIHPKNTASISFGQMHHSLDTDVLVFS